MAKRAKQEDVGGVKVIKKRTSVGSSRRTKPKNKSKRRNFKKSRGQGSGRR